MKDIAETIKHHLDELYERQVFWNEELQKIGLSERRAAEIFKEACRMMPKASFGSNEYENH